MFTGIIRGIGKVVKKETFLGLTKFFILFPQNSIQDLQIGASVSINGVCLTVVSIEETTVLFDAIQETLHLTNLNELKEGDPVNIERSARFGDEIGGHLLSGHIFDTAILESIEKSENNCIFTLKCAPQTAKYLFKKGYIALDGASLTLVLADKKTGIFTVHLIPETLRATTFSAKKVGDRLNVEIDTQTQIMVDTILES